MKSQRVAGLVIAVVIGYGTPAFGQSNTGVTNAAPEPRTSVPAAGPRPKKDTSPGGVTNGPPASFNAIPTPKAKAKVKSAVKRAYKSSPAGVDRGAPNAITKIPKVHHT